MTKVLTAILIFTLVIAGYLTGSNDGKAFKEQFVDLSFVCIQELTKNAEYHQKQARRIMQTEELTKEQSNAYVKSVQFMCMERKVLK